ncbi:MAG: ribokinase [Phycisphaerae bacterium]
MAVMSSSRQPRIVIIGSVNMDLVVRASHVPAPGETVLGGAFATIPGGKGANQAVGVARLGAEAVMVGRVGDDAFGRRLLAGLRENGVETSFVRETPETPSGIALIVVGDDGQNAITVAGGANARVSPADVDAARPALGGARVCLLQLELPVETVLHAIELCRRLGVETILDPAPAPVGAPEALFQVDVLTPNESEAALLTGLSGSAEPRRIAEALVARGAGGVVLKRGADGAYVFAPPTAGEVPGFAVQVVDSTAAGDAFTAALAVARAAGQPLESAVRFANAAGALACTKLGAQPSLPTLADVNALLT